jgi:hypothetical protein
VDESKGGVEYEMQMTVGEFFAKCCQGFEPEVVEAIPLEWLQKKRKYASEGDSLDVGIAEVLDMWEKEAEGGIASANLTRQSNSCVNSTNAQKG